MQEKLKRYSAKVVADGGMPLEARIGANTGDVVVRSIRTGDGHVEYTPIGHTTNLASRMQAVAPTGSIAVSEPVRKLVEGYFQLKARGPTRVKGLSEPVNVYEILGLGPLRTRLQRAAGRGLTKFVGRQREIDALGQAAEQTKAGHGQIVAVMAEPGVGKSRLFYEFKALTQADWMVLEAFSVSHGKASAYLPIMELLHGYFRFSSDDDARIRREKVMGRVLALERALEDTLPYAGAAWPGRRRRSVGADGRAQLARRVDDGWKLSRSQCILRPAYRFTICQVAYLAEEGDRLLDFVRSKVARKYTDEFTSPIYHAGDKALAFGGQPNLFFASGMGILH